MTTKSQLRELQDKIAELYTKISDTETNYGFRMYDSDLEELLEFRKELKLVESRTTERLTKALRDDLSYDLFNIEESVDSIIADYDDNPVSDDIENISKTDSIYVVTIDKPSIRVMYGTIGDGQKEYRYADTSSYSKFKACIESYFELVDAAIHLSQIGAIDVYLISAMLNKDMLKHLVLFEEEV